MLAIASLAHSMGLSVGLKDLPQQAPMLEPSFDWAIDEQCFAFQECGGYGPSFLAANKAVFDVEYDVAPNCARANAMHLDAQRRDLGLTGPGGSGFVHQTCVPGGQMAW